MPKQDNKKKRPPTSSSLKRRGKKRVVVFDPEARRSYLQGFSERKRQRRAYGLAMQRVKDRKAKIEQRAQEKKDDMDRIETAERQKDQLLTERLLSTGVITGDTNEYESSDEENDGEKKMKEEIIETKTFDDTQTESNWGGQVTVTTSMVDMAESSDEDVPRIVSTKKGKKVDVQQQFAGTAEKYMMELKGNMPGKKKAGFAKRKGRNGAADMKGVGGAGNLKIAQRVLAKSKAANTSKRKQGKKSRR